MQSYSISDLWCGLVKTIVETTPGLVSIDRIEMKKIDLPHNGKHFDRNAKVKVTTTSPAKRGDQDWYHIDVCQWFNGLP